MRTLATVVALFLAAGQAHAQRVTFEEETEPYPGVVVLERHTADPSWRIHAAFVSLCHDGVHVDARSSQSTRITSADWGSAMGAQLAVNGDFYRTDRTAPTVYGDAVGVGLRWPTARTGLDPAFAGDWYYRRYGWIAFGDGWVELNHTERVKQHAAELGVALGLSPGELTTEIPAGTRALVSGFPELVVEGQVMTGFPDRGDMADRHPRTAMGLTADRQTFLLVVVDGRSSASVGMTGRELAALMGELGAHVAFNLDGGGSSQMWIAGQGTVNDPSDGAPRAVANHWGVFAGAGHDRGQAPGSCFTAGGCYPAAIPEAIGSRFADLPDDTGGQWAAALFVDRGDLGACAGGEREMFCPACPLTRRDAARLVVRAGGVAGSAPASPTFSDVPLDDPAFAEIEAALAAGLMTGCGDGAFCPDAPIARADLVALLAGAAPGCDVAAGEGERVPRLEAAVMAAAALDVDRDGSCEPDSDPDGDGEEEAGDGESGGCGAAGAGGSPAWLALVLLCVGASRRRRK
jgi:uncharacterized protein (TIGR03382 family)